MAGAGKRQRLVLRIAAIPMGLLAISCLYPIFFAVNNSLKTRHDYLQDRFGLALNPTLDNFAQAWSRSHLDQYFLNSVIATVGAVILLTVVSSLAGFALAALRFPYRRFLFVVILSSLMIPVQVVLVPYMRTMLALNLINTHAGLILSYTAFFLPFSVYMMTAFYSGLPRELIDRSDGRVRHDDGDGAVGILLRRHGRSGDCKTKQSKRGDDNTLHCGSSLCDVLFFASLYLGKDGLQQFAENGCPAPAAAAIEASAAWTTRRPQRGQSERKAAQA